MKNRLKGLSKNPLALLLIIVIFLFYWFQIRPASIRAKCVDIARQDARDLLKTLIDKPGESGQKELEDTYKAGLVSKESYDNYYERCLNRHGLKD